MNKLRKILLSVVSTLTVFLSVTFVSEKPARAQFAVTDFPQISANLANNWREVSAILEELGINLEQLDWMETIMDAAGKISDFAKDLGMIQSLYRSLTFQAANIKYYAAKLKHMEEYGFNGYLITDLRRSLTYGYNTVVRLIKNSMKLLSDSGLSKSDKLKMLNDEIAKISSWVRYYNDKLDKRFGEAEIAQSYNEFFNLLEGKEANAEISGLYSDEGFQDTFVETTVEEAYGDKAEEAKRITRTGIYMIYTFIGVLLAFSLIFLTIKYIRGDPGSENGFMKVFVVIVLSIVWLGVLRAVLNI